MTDATARSATPPTLSLPDGKPCSWGGDDVGPKVRDPTVTLGSRRACLGPAWEAYRHPNASSSRRLGSAPAPGSTFEPHREHLTQREPEGRPAAGERAAESTSAGVRWDGPRGGPGGGVLVCDGQWDGGEVENHQPIDAFVRWGGCFLTNVRNNIQES